MKYLTKISGGSKVSFRREVSNKTTISLDTMGRKSGHNKRLTHMRVIVLKVINFENTRWVRMKLILNPLNSQLILSQTWPNLAKLLHHIRVIILSR